MLSADDSPDTVEQISLELDDGNWTVRAAAAKALAKMHDTKAIPKLETMMQTDHEPAARLSNSPAGTDLDVWAIALMSLVFCA